tara:strand:- start:219 stop:563 length:345 start_codon:yes stop_codon:yes gene_type:complete
VNIFLGKIITLSFCLMKRTDKQKTRAILDIFEPIELPTARIVSFSSADSMDINISGAEVAIPMMKKLAANPEIEYADENRSVDVTSRLAPTNKSVNPRTKKNTGSIMTYEVYMR